MGKWVIGSGSSKIKPIPFNTRVYGYTGKRVWLQSNSFHTRLIGSGSGRVRVDPTHWQAYLNVSDIANPHHHAHLKTYKKATYNFQKIIITCIKS